MRVQPKPAHSLWVRSSLSTLLARRQNLGTQIAFRTPFHQLYAELEFGTTPYQFRFLVVAALRPAMRIQFRSLPLSSYAV